MNSHQRRTARREFERGHGSGELAWIESCAKACRCCRRCEPSFCAGVAAGGLCDRMCICSDDDETVYDDDCPYEDDPS